MKHLQPVVKKKTSYSVLFLRDDSKVVSFRLKPFWIKFLGVIFLLFSGASGAAGYSAHYYWKKYQTLQHERSELAEKLGENRRQLGRFAGVERIKEATLPRSAMTGVNTIAAGPEGTNGKPNGEQNGDNTAAPAQNGGSPPAGPAETATAEAPGTPQPAAPDASPPPAATGQPPAETATASATPPASPESADKEHPALISEVQVRAAGNRTFRLAFDLSNRDQQLTLNGRVQVSVGTKSGERHEITQINRDALRFIINRYKRVNTNFVLPGDIQTEDVDRLFLTVTAEDQPTVTYSFTVPTPS